MPVDAPAEPIRVVRAAPGRLRLHVSGWDGAQAHELEMAIRSLPGVSEVTARPATRNVLVHFDSERTSAEKLAAAIEPARLHTSADQAMDSAAVQRDEGDRVRRLPGPRVGGILRDGAGRFARARIAVRGIDRDPALARRVVEVLERRPEVRRAAASATTGRVLVEFSDRVTSLQDLLADISRLELPDMPGEDRPEHPLDPAPVLQSGARVIGSALGLGLLAVQRLLGVSLEGGALQGPGVIAGAVGIIEGAPPVRDGLRQRLGRDRAQLLLSGAAIVSLSAAGSPLGLLVTGGAALRLLVEARARRDAWREYETRVAEAVDAQPGAVVRVEAGGRVPLEALVIEGTGTILGADGLPDSAAPGMRLPAGARVLRGPLVLELQAAEGWSPSARPGELPADLLRRYLAVLGPASTGYALVHALRRRSPAAIFTGLLLVNPRAALIGSEAADTGACARVLRAGVTVVGTRPERQIRRPDVLILDGPRVLSTGLEQSRIIAVKGDRGELTETILAMLAASGAPWGSGLPPAHGIRVEQAEFDGEGINAKVGARRLRLAPPGPGDEDDAGVQRAMEAGEQALLLRRQAAEGVAGDGGAEGEVIAQLHLRPRLAAGAEALRARCERLGTNLVLLEREDRRASRAVARRTGLELVLEADLVELVREHQRAGHRVAVLSDTPAAAEAFEACDLAIALSSGHSSQFQARADLLAPELPAVLSIVAAGALRDQASVASVLCSAAANVAGALWGLQGEPGLLRASQATYLGALGALAGGWLRLRGGRRSRSIVSRLNDPRPERWGRMDTQEVLDALNSRTAGLSGEEAERRQVTRPKASRRNSFLSAMLAQLESPLVAVLGAGAALSLAVGAAADVAIIGAVLVANAGVGAWQERQAGQAAEALEHLGAPSARVLRDGQTREVTGEQVVVGDVLLLGAGDRVIADARLLQAEALEVDEAALTGESLPVAKGPNAEAAEARIVLEGADVTVGTARAVVVAVGAGTRMGATAAALTLDETAESPLSRRLEALFRQGLPLVLAGGALVTFAGIAWGGAPVTQLAVGASVAVAAVPEGLPLLAGVAEASVARRLASRNALVRRLSSVEALGRVDVACCDKTGTLTRGELAVTMLDTLQTRVPARGELGERARWVLLTAGLASPSPHSPDALAHPTDAAILQAAQAAGLGEELLVARTEEAPFDPARALHATCAGGRVCVKGAAEVLVDRCQLDADERAALLHRAEALAAQGLRVLMVAEGSQTRVDDPQDLTAVGFVGISDPLREGVSVAVAKCRAAGVRLIMLTGDHPATARRIATDAGLLLDNEAVMTGEDLIALDNGTLQERLERAAVVARITPIDKLRIVEALQAAGHTVAMTGDGVNDAPALRLADVGVAMGAGGTEVARQAADLVLADDRFETLVEALVEGRSLWRNLHGALGLLLGGNLGEIGLMAGAAIAGRGAVLGTRQVLAVNLITDVLPAVAVAVQAPRERDLALMEREGENFDERLVGDILRRGAATAVPSLVAVLAAAGLGAAPSTVAFGSIIVTQLAQTLQAGRSQNQLSGSVMAAIAGSGGVLVAALAPGPLRRFLALSSPDVRALALIAATGPAANVMASRLATSP